MIAIGPVVPKARLSSPAGSSTQTVLSLTGFKTPDVLKSVYVEKALQVMNTDSRQRIVSRRVLTPKGETDGGGGGAENGVSQLRKCFRVLAFWLGSVTTDARGHVSADIKLPESLTTYRIMAVAADKASRFGSDESEIRINKPVVLKAAFPRFMTRGDKAYFGSVVTSQLKQPGSAIVTMRSLDPAVLQVSGETRRVVQVGAGGSTEVRFDVVATGVGRARAVQLVEHDEDRLLEERRIVRGELLPDHVVVPAGIPRRAVDDVEEDPRPFDVAEERVAQPRPARRALDQSGDVGDRRAPLVAGEQSATPRCPWGPAGSMLTKSAGFTSAQNDSVFSVYQTGSYISANGPKAPTST